MDNTNVPDTPQNANPQDTSQAFETPAPVETEGSQNNFSIDDIILGNVDETAPAFTQPEVPVTEETIQPEVGNTPEAPDGAKNDPNRYQYWQSRAAKLENQMDEFRAQQQQVMMQQNQAQAQPEPEPERFPDAPAKPSKPNTFSRDEAYSDPSSESARYLDDVDSWRDNMDEYNALRNQYDLAVMQEKLDNETNHRKQIENAQRAQVAQAKQVSEITSHVTQQYGMDANEANEFITQMSDPQSLTMDNLVQLWRFQKGQGAPTNAPTPAQPSPAFQQTQRAQQVPSPMGVLPGSSQAAQGSAEDQIMDNMVKDFNSKNPWTK